MAKADQSMMRERVEEVTRLLLAGAEFADIRKYAQERNWQVSDRHVRRYIERAYSGLQKYGRRQQGQLLGRHLMQRRALYARSVKAGDVRTALQVVRDEANLLGLYQSGKGQSAAAASSHAIPIALNKRISMILAAEARADKRELELLAHADVTIGITLPDSALPIVHLEVLAMIHVVEQLDAAVLYLHATSELSWDEGSEDDGIQRRMLAMFGAYLYRTGKEAWAKFTTRAKLDGEHLVRSNYAGQALILCDGWLCACAPSSSMVMDVMREAGMAATRVVTADDLAASWQRLYTESLS